MKLKLLSLTMIFCLWGACAFAADENVVELPQEELAKESVLPVFDRSMSVKDRNVVTAGKWDVNGMFGMALSEPIYSVNRYSLSGYYNTSENNAYGFIYIKNSSGVSSYANQLHGQFGLDFSRAPAPLQSYLFDWNDKLFYGKMSLGKETVLNTSLYWSLTGGEVQFQNKSYPTVAIGVGQKFFFTNTFALRFDLRLFGNDAPIPFLKNSLKDGSQGGSADPTPSYGDFQERWTWTTVLDVGLTWLL